LVQKTGNKLHVIYLGTMMESKGFVDLVYAAPLVVREVPDVEFVLVGDGRGFAEYDRVQAWVAEQRLEEHVKFFGPKWGEEKKRALLNADVFCFPARNLHEGQPLVIIEAMSAGLPIVTTRSGANENTLGAEGALYARSKDPGDLARQLLLLLKDPEKRRQMGTHNRQRFVELYTVDSFAANLGAAFNRVLGISGPKSIADSATECSLGAGN
jgi:glycosyltransferase involved in cell wall biosynthesis